MGKTIRVLIPFELCVDDEFGLIRFIRDKVYDKSVFVPLIEAHDTQLAYFLIDRPTVNPLYNFMVNEQDVEGMNSLYKLLMSKYYPDILTRAMRTSLFTVVNMYNSAPGIEPVILCSNRLQSEYMDNIQNEFQIPHIIGSLENVNLSDFNALYIKNFFDAMYAANQIKGMNLYIADYKFNFAENSTLEEPHLLQEPMLIFGDCNVIKITEVYHFDEEDIPV